jgi:hypothetical protein
MKVTLFYKLKSIDHPDEKWGYCRSLGLWHIPKTYIRRIYVNAVDNPEYPVPLGYWEWTTIQRRPTLVERWVDQLDQGYTPTREHYDCTVPDQIVEKILAKLGWEDFKHPVKDKWWLKHLSDEDLKWLTHLSDEELKWCLLVKHLINETEYESVGVCGLRTNVWDWMAEKEAEAEAKEIESDFPRPAMLNEGEGVSDTFIEKVEIWEEEIERRKEERAAEKKREQAKRIYEI